MRKLNAVEFADALRKGLGRALMHVRSWGDRGVKRHILSACLLNQVYERHLDKPRFDWIHEILKASGNQDYYVDSALSALQRLDESADLDYVAQFAAFWAGLGNTKARRALDTAFEKTGIGAIEIVTLDGIEGLLRVARKFGKTKLEIDVSSAVFEAERRVAPEEVREALAKAAASDESTRLFWEEAYGWLGSNAGRPLELDLEKVFADIEAKHTRYGYVSWGRGASDADIVAVCERIQTERRTKQLLPLLSILRRRAVPAARDMLAKLARSRKAGVRYAAFSALGNIHDPRVRDLAISELARRGSAAVMDDVIWLFILNYQSGDGSLIEAALPKQPDPAKIYRVGSSLVHLAENHNEPALAGCLKWLYESTPCTYFRFKAVQALVKSGELSEAMKAECRYDCEKGIREAVGQDTLCG